MNRHSYEGEERDERGSGSTQEEVFKAVYWVERQEKQLAV